MRRDVGAAASEAGALTLASGLASWIESREPRAESREPRAESREPRAESREPRAESREPRAESREPRAESREPRAESREPSCVRRASHLPHSQRAVDAMGRAEIRPRERHSRRLTSSCRPSAAPSFPVRHAGLAARFRRARHGSAWLLAVCLALLLGAGAAQAQTSVKLVGNSGQTLFGSAKLHLNDVAQAFTTGSTSAGYKLTSVDLFLAAGTNTHPTYTVRIQTNASGSPGNIILGTLTAPTSIVSGSNTFTASGAGIRLSANTTYFVVIDVRAAGTDNLSVNNTTSDAEDSGAAAGWSIGNDSRSRTWNSTGAWTTGSESYLMAVNGTVNSAPTVAKAIPDRAATVSKAFRYAFPANTFNDADSGETLTYRATRSNGTALPSWLTFTPRTRSFSGKPAPADVGTLSVKVTASDRLATVSDTFDITVGADTTAPRVTGMTVSGNQLVITVNEDLNTAITPSNTAFSVSIKDVGEAAPDAVAVARRTVTLTLARTTTATNETVTVTYLPLGTNVIQDVSGNKLPGWSDARSVVNLLTPVITVAAGTSPVKEGTAAEFTVTADPAPGAELTVKLTVSDVSGSDFVASGNEGAKTVKIAANATSASYSVATVNDTTDEPDGPVKVAVGAGTGYTVGKPGSASVTVRDNDAPAGNHAPRVFRERNSPTNSCEVHTSTTTPARTISYATHQRLRSLALVTRGTETTEWPLGCTVAGNRNEPLFDDRDAEKLTIRIDSVVVPDKVKFYANTPLLASQRLFFALINGGTTAQTVRINLTAEDIHGQEVSTFINIDAAANVSLRVPTFPTPAGPRRLAKDAPIAWTLPPASGGDLFVVDHDGDFSTPEQPLFDYTYAVSGLPAGLSFDPATRTISGTPTAAGTSTVTYTAHDADATVTNADRASQTFKIEVQAAAAPTIEHVRIVSLPSYDSNCDTSAGCDGVFDTYIRSDKIMVDLDFSEPVVVGGDEGLRLRLDLGTDDADLTNSATTISTVEDWHHAGRTLRFVHTVKRGDADSDGVWVQTGTVNSVANTVLRIPGNATVKSAATGAAADLTFSGLLTTGDALHKVDATKTSTPGPRPRSAAMDGKTLTVTFTEFLNTSVDADQLKWYFKVRGTDVDSDGGDRNAGAHPHRVTVSGATVTLYLRTPARRDQDITLSYNGNLLEDRDTTPNKAPPFREFGVVNNTGGELVPLLVRARVAGKQLTLTFDEALNTASTPPGSAFRVFSYNPLQDETHDIRGTGTATVSGTTVTVTLARAVADGERVWMNYYRPDTGQIQAARTGNPEAEPFKNFTVSNPTDTTAPALLGTSAQGTKVAIYFDEALDTGSTPAATDFAVKQGTDSATTSSVAIEHNAVVLTLAEGFPALAQGSVTYTVGSNPIRDAAGNGADGFSRTLIALGTGKPTVGTAIVDGAQLVLSFTKDFDPASVPDTSAFAVHYALETGEIATDRRAFRGRIDTVTFGPITVYLQLEHPAHPCDELKVSYTKPGSGNKLKGLDGTETDSVANQSVRNERSDRCADSWMNGLRSGSVIITAKRPFATDTAPQASWFTVTASGGPVTVTGAAFSADDPRELKLSLSREFTPGETVTVSYTRPPGERGLWDIDGNQLGNFANEPLDTSAPEPARFVSAATEPQGRGLWLTFTKDIWVAGNHADYTVLVGGERRATTAASWEDNRVALVLTEPVRAGETVTVAYAKPSEGVKLHDTDELAVESFGPEAVENTVVAAPAPLTASFEGVPAAHEGRGGEFSFSLVFSENFGGTLNYRVLRDAALHATNGRVTGASRAAQGQNQRWTITVRPHGSGDVRVTLAATTDCALPGAVCTPDGRALSNALTATVSGPVTNAPATGAPTITGTAQVGQTLTASTSGIADADGLTGATFTYQWVSHDGTTDADISGATGSSYLLVDSDVGRRIKVRVTFTDDAGNAESLTSGLTAAVLPRPLTATFEGMPAEHDGSTAFEFALVFSENFPGRLPFKSLRDEWLKATNGRVTGVRRASPGQNQNWVVTVQPDSHLDVTVTLPEGSVTTESGRTLSNTVTATVIGPPLLSVADAQAQEGTDTAVAFAVTLSRAASGAVTVDYATADGTATAGEDYTATSGTLTFAAAETSKTVTVPIHDDAHDEGQETFTLTLANASGAAILDGEATGTIDNDDPMPKAWTARFGRTVAVHVVDAVEARLEGESGSWAQLGGHRLGGVADDPETAQGLTLDRDLWAEAEAASPSGDNVTFRNLLLGSAFHLVSNGEDTATGPRLSAWGRVASSGFDAQEDKVSLNGTVTTATLGVDGVWKRWLTGLLLAYSEGDGSFTHADLPGGDLTSSLTSVHPYVAYTLNDRVRLWGLVGYGSGALRLDLEDRDAMDTDLTMSMGAVGLRGTLLQPAQPGGLELALRSDVLWMVMDSAAAHDLAATEAEASRLRLVLEGSRPVALAGGGSFIPSLEVGLRHDAGDAETGTGIELGGSLRYASAWGLSIEASVRTLLAHEAEDYREWGAGGALRFDPGRQGKGFTASIVPTWGTASSGMSRLWDQAGTAGLTPSEALASTAAGRLEAELGYGLAALHGRGLLTPYARVALTEGADQAWHLGTRLVLAKSLNFSLEASRRAREGDRAAHEVALLANLGF